ncbi:MAG: DEAD/DEAH box helicase [Clostridiales Family XIII bacterium]|jgi:ATP-dependent RNA helicase DeaD|nr:DEAD/DEAH box helicase [Clostridiales Family XIII bacterium]
MNYRQPSPVQDAAIRPLLDRQDALVQAPTGTGKTAAFGIPIVENTDPDARHIQTVILSPTRELAAQTASVLKQIAAYKPGVRILCLYGGEPIRHQIMALKRRPQIIVATPGRMIDHMTRRTTRLDNVGCIVLDEADRMLDMGFRDDIAMILESVPADRQTVLFSATLSNDIKRIAATHQSDAQQICIQQDVHAVEKVQQYYSEVRGNVKTSALLQLLEEKRFGLSLVFVATKAMADNLAGQLTSAGHPADAIHGDLRQSQRNKVMRRYRDGKVAILVATDVAARGIDVDGIDAVINYDIPMDSDSYIHRVGRTGRAEQSGTAYTFIYPRERGKLKEIMVNTKASILPVAIGDWAAPSLFTEEGSGQRPGRGQGARPGKRTRNGSPAKNGQRARDGQHGTRSRDGQNGQRAKDGQYGTRTRDGQSEQRTRDGQHGTRSRDGQFDQRTRNGQRARNGQRTEKTSRGKSERGYAQAWA